MNHEVQLRRLNNIVDELRTIADIEWQRSAWSVEHSTLLNSYRETIAQIYDSYDAEEMFSSNLEDLGVSESARVKIAEALSELGSYYDAHDLDPPSEVLLADPQWIALSRKVGESLEGLK